MITLLGAKHEEEMNIIISSNNIIHGFLIIFMRLCIKWLLAVMRLL